MGKGIITLLAALFVSSGIFARPEEAPDTLSTVITVDSALLQTTNELSNYTSPLISNTNKPTVSDVQQFSKRRNNTVVFLVLVLLLVILTYIKTAFGNDLQDVLQSFINRSAAQQVFRTQMRELTISSLLLHVNFILVFTLYVRFYLVKYQHVSTLESFPSILFLTFLFTFFYLSKLIMLKVIGVVFEANEVCDEYIFNFTTVCKTLGLTLIPALFIFYTAPEKFFDFIFVLSVIVVIIFVLAFLWRGLSTGYKLLYTSVYHFFIYVCVVEVSPIFLLFKLLTKPVV